MLRILTFFGAVLLGVGAVFTVKAARSGAFAFLPAIGHSSQLDATFQRGFRSDTILRANQLRLPNGIEGVSVDEGIQEFISSYLTAHSQDEELDLEQIFDSLQAEFPGAQYLAANLVNGNNREELLESLYRWDAVGNEDFNALTTSVFERGGHLSALGVMSRRIPFFSLEEANRTGGKFYNKCPHCGTTHALVLDPKARTLILSCPDCERPFDVLAADSNGRLYRANQFLTGYALEETDAFRAAQSGEEKVLALWQQVASHCTYELDQNHNDAREAWKRPEETWQQAVGDCEDTAILLTDALISAGFEARVAIGWNGNIGQHAWSVVKVGDRQYVLESTLQGDLDFKSLVPVDQAADFYKPEQLFDRDHLYFCAGDPTIAGSNCFSDNLWQPLSQLDNRELNVTSR